MQGVAVSADTRPDPSTIVIEHVCDTTRVVARGERDNGAGRAGEPTDAARLNSIGRGRR